MEIVFHGRLTTEARNVCGCLYGNCFVRWMYWLSKKLLLSKFKILWRVAPISGKVAYVGRVIISLLVFESLVNKNFFFLMEKNNLPSGLVYYQSIMFLYDCSRVHNKLMDPKRGWRIISGGLWIHNCCQLRKQNSK